MLVLSRQRDETIMIGDEIEITVVDIRGDKVRLGITAPTRIAVHRKEVYDAIRTENEQASRIKDGDIGVLAQTISPGPARTRSRANELASKARAGDQTRRAAGGNS
jgi:carbon storage regulator